jgi:hypothetical protein
MGRLECHQYGIYVFQAFTFNHISGWDVSSVTIMDAVRMYDSFNHISGWNVSSVTDMSYV